MYKIYADSTLIYDSTLDNYIISAGSVSKEVNKSGSFVFTLYQNHPYFDRIQKLKTIITVYKYDKIIFRGRVLTEDLGFYNDKTFTCEGELSFFLDSIQRPYEYTGAPGELLKQYIESHNDQVDDDKRFKFGEVTIADNNNYVVRSNVNYEDTLTNITAHLVNIDGGYLHITRDENGKPILNWLANFTYQNGQKIEFGENLLDFTRTNNAEEIATGIIPLGAKLETEDNENENRLTIASVNDGLDYIVDDTAVATYGRIFKVVIWDDVTTAENLLEKAREYLKESINQLITIELTAVDLSLLDSSIDDFELGDYIEIVSKPHGVNERLLLQKQTIDLLKPDNDTITLGHTYSSFTDRTLTDYSKNENLINTVENINRNYVSQAIVIQKVDELQGQIDQTNDYINDGGSWTELTISDEYNLYDSDEDNTPMYKVAGKVVTIRGALSPKEEYTSSETPVEIVSGIPSKLCPDKDCNFVCQGSGLNRWTATVTTEGKITMSRYGASDYAIVPIEAKLEFLITYTIK